MLGLYPRIESSLSIASRNRPMTYSSRNEVARAPKWGPSRRSSSWRRKTVSDPRHTRGRASALPPPRSGLVQREALPARLGQARHHADKRGLAWPNRDLTSGQFERSELLALGRHSGNSRLCARPGLKKLVLRVGKPSRSMGGWVEVFTIEAGHTWKERRELLVGRTCDGPGESSQERVGLVEELM